MASRTTASRLTRQFGQMMAPLDRRVLFDLRLPADHRVRADARAGLDEHALVDEAGPFDRRAVLDARVGGDRRCAAPAGSRNGAAAKRPSMMSRCTCVYFSGVPMSIQ